MTISSLPEGHTVSGKGIASDSGKIKAVGNRWTGLVDWTTGLDYWTDVDLKCACARVAPRGPPRVTM